MPQETPRFRRPDEAEEYPIAERCRILETWNLPADPALSVARARVAPGITTRWHRLTGICERYLILSGRGRVEVGDLAPETIGPGDFVYIPAGRRQRIANLGDGELVFLALCTPRFVPDAYGANCEIERCRDFRSSTGGRSGRRTGIASETLVK